MYYNVDFTEVILYPPSLYLLQMMRRINFYDRKHDLYEATLLTRCYTQHATRPYIDSEINHIRHFIKIPFINKGIEFIELPSIFPDNNVISAIPSCFENTESPII